MDVKVLKTFYDRKEGVMREAGSLFACTAQRMKEVNDIFPCTLENVEKKAVRKKVAKEV